jgi:hypothetical protein
MAATKSSAKSQQKSVKISTWRQAAKLKLLRVSPLTGQLEELERGVNFFVLMLEKLGGKTQFSCEGHPNGFYVLFTGSYKLAQRIKACGFFTVEIEGANRWSIRMNYPVIETQHHRVLTWAAESWNRSFGTMTVKTSFLNQKQTVTALKNV